MGHKNGALHITWNTPQKNVEKFTKLLKIVFKSHSHKAHRASSRAHPRTPL